MAGNNGNGRKRKNNNNGGGIFSPFRRTGRLSGNVNMDKLLRKVGRGSRQTGRGR